MIVKTASELPSTDEVSLERELFSVEVRPMESGDFLVLTGELNLDAASHLREAALGAAAAGKEVAIDWSAAGHLSAGALQVLVALRATLSSRGQALDVAADNPGVRRILEIAGLSGLFPVREAPG